MFTGIVTDIGEVSTVEAKADGLRRIVILCNYDRDSIAIGASIACSGVCLTVVETGLSGNRTWFAVDAAAETAALRDKPALFYYWGPTWLLGEYAFTMLEEPPFDQAKWDAMMAAEHPTEATAYPVSKVVIGANKAFTEAAPKLAAFLSAYGSTSATTSAMLAYMQENDASAEDAAVHFLKTSEDWTKWVPADVAERVRASLNTM